jgi:hypothetical protein
MGTISRFNLKKIREDFNLHSFVETGSWYGDGINWALAAGFQVFSCEINHRIFQIVKDRFEGRYGCTIINASSEDFLPHIPDVPALYFLDAHYPHLYLNKEEIEDPNYPDFSDSISFPMIKELEIISKKRNFQRSIIIIDDWRIYDKTLEYENGSIGDNIAVEGMDEFLNKFDHHRLVFTSDEGYMIMIPKTMDKDSFKDKYTVRMQ